MSASILSRAITKTVRRRAASHRVGAAVRRGTEIAVHVLISPFRLILSIRRSMTAASVTLLLFGIISLNIVWGYPWVGMFAASITMLLLGWIINRVMRPSLKVDFSLPNSSPAGDPFLVTMHLRNRSRFPAMELSVDFENDKHHQSRKNPSNFRSLDQRQRLAIIRSSEHRDATVALTGIRRGIHRLPDVSIESMFPFHLFRSQQRSKTSTLVAITPRLLSPDDDPIARGLLDTLGGWSLRLLAGDALDYTGSREYEVGMPVRRWDFTSWARLGRPIVREFQSPSIQTVTILVDTGFAGSIDIRELDNSQATLERMLSLAAVAINDLCRKLVRVRVFVTSENRDDDASPIIHRVASDPEPMLIQLAAAHSVDTTTADQRIAMLLDHAANTPILLLTRRDVSAASSAASTNKLTTIRVDDAHRKSHAGAHGKPHGKLQELQQR